jgi:hypothetical protein
MAFCFVIKGTIYFIFEAYIPTYEKYILETISLPESFFYFHIGHHWFQVSGYILLARADLHFFHDPHLRVDHETRRRKCGGRGGGSNQK